MINANQQQNSESELRQFLKYFQTNKTQAELPLYDLEQFFFFFSFKPITNNDKQRNLGKIKLTKNNQEITLKYIKLKLLSIRKDGFFLEKDLAQILLNDIDVKFLQNQNSDLKSTFTTLQYMKEFIRPVAQKEEAIQIQKLTQEDLQNQILKQISSNFQSIISGSIK